MFSRIAWAFFNPNLNQQSSLNFDPLPKPGELFTYGTTLYQMYEKLLADCLDSVEAQKMSMTHSRRISDIREKLKPFCLTVKKEKDRGRIYKYKISRGL